MKPYHEEGMKSISFGPNIQKQIQDGTMDLPSEDLRNEVQPLKIKLEIVLDAIDTADDAVCRFKKYDLLSQH